MTGEPQALVSELRSFLPLTEDRVDDFDELLVRVADSGDARCIRPLLDLFDDKVSLSGVLQSVATTLEAFSPEVYASELTRYLPELRRRSEFWAANELKKFMWTGQHRRILANAVRDLGEPERDVAKQMIVEVGRSVPKLAAASDELLTEIDA